MSPPSPFDMLRMVRNVVQISVCVCRLLVSREFDITTEVRQGNVLAPVMFNLFFDAVIAATMSTHSSTNVRMLCSQEGALVGGRRKMIDKVIVSDLECSDDMARVSDSMDALEEALRVLNCCVCDDGPDDQCKDDKGLGSSSYLHTQCTS